MAVHPFIFCYIVLNLSNQTANKSMTKIIFLDRLTFPEEMLLKRPSFPHSWQEYETTNPNEVIARLQDAEIAITNKVPLNKQTLAQCPNLKMIAITATGYNHIDIDYANERGITVSNIRGYATTSVPEHVMMMILALSRSAFGFRKDVQNANWQQAKSFCFFSHPIEDLKGKTLAIIGRGNLGKGLEKLALCFGMKVIFADRKGKKNPQAPYTSFEHCLSKADIISLHCPLNEQTEGLITEKEFAQMKHRPILINAARGGIINEHDAVKALETGQIRALGVDCLSSEPPTNDNPLLSIADRPNVIITPHVAWASSDALNILWEQLIENIEEYKKGAPRNQILP